MAPVQVIPVPVVMCNVFGQQVFPAMAFPGMKAQVGIVPQQHMLQQQQQPASQQLSPQHLQQQQQQLMQQQLPQQQQQQQLSQQQLPQQQLAQHQQGMGQQQPMSPQQQPMHQQMLQVQPFPQAWAAARESWRPQEWQAPEPEWQAPEAEDEPSRPLLSTSARRRLRRQRAALRRPASLEVQSDGQATPPPPEMSTPSGESVGEHPSSDELPEGSEGEGASEVPVMDIQGSVARLSFDRHGCRIVQDVIGQAERPLAARLVAELHGRVREAMASPHANYVLQTVITALPLHLSGFIIKELLGFGASAAKHRFGCRILCRLIEHAGAREEMAPLLDEVLAESEEFCRHPFAHHVVECAVEHVPERRKQIAQALCINAKINACHRCASHVVEAVLLHSKEEQKEQMVASLRGGGGMSMLARNQFGCYVVKAVLRLPNHLSDEARIEVANEAAVISSSRYGHRLLKDLGMASTPTSSSH